jgi:chorismate mutase
MSDKALDVQLAEIDQAIAAGNASVDAIKADLRKLTAQRNSIVNAIAAAKKLASISPAERAALKELLGA